MSLEMMLDVREPEVKHADRADAQSLFDRRYVTSAGRLTQAELSAIVYERVRALLAAHADVLDAALLSAAVEQSWSGVISSQSDLAPSSAHDARPVLAEAVAPQMLCRLFTAIGSVYADLTLVPQALIAYRGALQYSLQTNDPVLIGATRGRLARLAIQHQH